ncbi:MAG: RimK family protein [Thiolinea sp.]
MYNTLIVVDNADLSLSEHHHAVISFEKYLRDYPKLNEQHTRIINLCDTERYLSKGYYCSLLAEARKHKVLPGVKTINRLRDAADIQEEITLLIRQQRDTVLADLQGEHWLYFGKTQHSGLKKLGQKLFEQYPTPIMRLEIKLRDEQPEVTLERASLAALNAEQRKYFDDMLNDFTQHHWRTRTAKRQHRWDMAILVDKDEAVPPSDPVAISRFVKAAAKYGINAEVVSYQQLQNIANYDALFIRETTAIDHHTYRLARKAEDAGLVVMDDPTSILRCCNKVYLHDAFNYQKVPSLKTEVIDDCSENTLDKLEAAFAYPLILKMPEGSFSRGVFKVSSRAELSNKLEELLAVSALVLAQEFLYTEFDWRIGVLNGRAIYASRYLMARNHWQIYNHNAGKRHFSGGFETLPTFEVPKFVLDAALKASAVVGCGLYGVDIKEVNKKAYVLEVNDNPSLDSRVEDAYLGNELYMLIMAEFQRRLEARGR